MLTNLKEIILDFGLQYTKLQWSNLAEVGKLLNVTKKIKSSLSSQPSSELLLLVTELEKLFEAYIMQEYNDKNIHILQIESILARVQDAVLESNNQNLKPNSNTQMLSEQLLEIKKYACENNGIIDLLEQKLLLLESRSNDESMINDIFRLVHTLKSETGFVGLKNVSNLCHELETLFSILRKGTFTLNTQDINPLLEVRDTMGNIFQLAITDPDKAVDMDINKQINLLKILVQKKDPTFSKNMATHKSQSHPVSVEHLTEEQRNDSTLICDFITESREHLDSMENKLMALEANPLNEDLLNEIFRPLHNIKGISGFLNFQSINRLAHEAESFLDMARRQKFRPDQQFVNITLTVVDAMNQLMELILVELDGNSFSDHQYPDINNIITDITHYIEDRASIFPQLILHSPHLKEIYSTEMPSEAREKSPISSFSVYPSSPSSPSSPSDESDESLETIQQHLSLDLPAENLRNSHEHETIKINAKKLENLLDMIGELVVAQTLISQSSAQIQVADKSFSKNVVHASKIVRNIQNISMGLRMVPVKHCLSKMNRLVRDLSLKAKKEVTLEIEGAETELDRNVIEYLNDPLVHMIRNSIDHGLESAEVREQAGKPKIGTIKLKAYHQGGNIIIEISDDGRGIDSTAVLEKAIEKKWIDEKESLSVEEINNLIFIPGFSTAEKVSDISGRGVGMDIVKKNIEKLGGHVVIESQKGLGIKFSIRLPLTMAIMEGMVLQVGPERYLLPVLSIKESIRASQGDILTIQNKGEMIKVRDTLIQLVRVHEVFGIKPASYNPNDSIIVIVETINKTYGLMVDKLLGQQQVVIKSMNYTFGDSQGISGYAILGDGQVGLILDPKQIFSLSRTISTSTKKVA